VIEPIEERAVGRFFEAQPVSWSLELIAEAIQLFSNSVSRCANDAPQECLVASRNLQRDSTTFPRRVVAGHGS